MVDEFVILLRTGGYNNSTSGGWEDGSLAVTVKISFCLVSIFVRAEENEPAEFPAKSRY